MTYPDFHIYITTLNEENLIAYTIEALLKVFPIQQLTVIDLGSVDATLDRIPSSIEVLSEILPRGNGEAGPFFTQMKANYSGGQEWVLWVDGDEIYPTSSLLKMVKWLEDAQAGRHDEKALRLYWRTLNMMGGKMQVSKEYMSAGPKLFNSKYFSFKRAWPKEVIYRLSDTTLPVSHKKEFNGIWFWHGVLLERSNIQATARNKKLSTKRDRYEKYLSWRDTDAPWAMHYNDTDVELEWTVVNMSETLGYDTKWHGILDE